MAEWKRIMCNRRLCVGLLLIVILNIFLFVREQVSQNYGLDCTLPTTLLSVSLSGGNYEAEQKMVDSWKAYSRYVQRLEEYKALQIADAIPALENERNRLTDLLAISNLLEDGSGIFISNALEQYREEQPGLVRQLENGEIELNKVQLDYVAVNNLLAQVEYLNGYDSYLNTIQANKAQMLSFSIFNDPNSFSRRNIIKTAEEFEALEGISLTLGADGAIAAFMNYPITDYLLLCALVLTCISFLDERKKGLWSVIHAAPNGRLRLALQRVGILLGVSVIGTLVLCGSNLLIGFSIYGGLNDLDRAVQSVELLGKMPLCYTVGQFLLRYLLFKVGATFVVALLLWLLFTVINNMKYTIIIAVCVLVVEYGLYTFLPVQSGWNLFKYFNIFTYISLSDLYTNYLNIDLFRYPIGIRMVSQFACLPLILLLGIVCITVHCRKRPVEEEELLGRFVYTFNRIVDGFLRRFHLLGMELYKTLVIQKGILIVLLFLYLVSRQSFIVIIPVESSTDAAERQYTAELAGEITDNTVHRIEALQTELNETMTAYEQAKMQYENGEMEYPQYDVFVREAENAEIRSNGLGIVYKRVEELRSLGEQRGFTPWLIDETPYRGTYGREATSNQQSAALTAMLTIILLLAGSMSYETQSGMNHLLSSTQRGRGKLFCIKIELAAIVSTAVWAVIYGLEFHTFLGICEPNTFEAAVQNLAMVGDFPIICSIGSFLMGVHLFRWLALFTCAMLTMLISSYVNRMETAYIAACGLILLPSVLYLYVRVKPLKYLSLMLLVEALPIVQAKQTFILLCALAVITSVSIYLIGKRLRVGKNLKSFKELNP